MGSAVNFDAQTCVTAVEGIVACEIEGGSALLDLSTSRYYKLNDTAALVWQELEQREDRSATLGHLATVVTSHFDVDDATCRHDLMVLFEGLARAGLVRLDCSAT